ELQNCEETLGRLLAPGHDPASPAPRSLLPPIWQAHRGSRDLTFGAAVYRPDHAGLNDRADVARLAEYLEAVCPESWAAAGLAAFGMGEEDAADEVEFAREWFPELVDLFRRTRDAGRLLIHERIY